MTANIQVANVGAKHHRVYLIVILMFFLILYFPMFIRLVKYWDINPNYGHGYFVPLAAAYLVWRKRKELKNLATEPYKLNLIILPAALLLYIIGTQGLILSASVLSFIIVIGWLMVTFLGKKMTRGMLFPLVFLLFIVPIPYLSRLTAPMQNVSSYLSAKVLGILQFTVYREGNIIMLPNMSLEVAAVCSGLRALVLVMTVGAFYAYITFRSNRNRWLLFLLCTPIAIVANVVRIVVTAVLAQYASSKIVFKFIHDFSGIFVFVVAGVFISITGVIIQWLFRRKGTGSSSACSP